MHIVILGAGAIGCALAAAWSAQARVTVFARPARVGTLAGGVTLRTASGKLNRKVPVTADPSIFATADLIVIATKATAIPELVQDIGPHLPAAPQLLSLMNGPTSASALADALGHPVLAGMVPWNSVWDDVSGLVVSGAGQVTMTTAPITERLAEVTKETALPAITNPDIARVLWGKLLLNLVNPVNALAGIPLKATLADGGHRTRYRLAYSEALHIMRAAKITPAKVAPLPPDLIAWVLGCPDWLFRSVFLPLQKLKPDASTSMAQDLTAGRETEIDWLNGAVVDLAWAMKMEAPHNAALIAEIEAATAQREHDTHNSQ